MCEWLEPEFSGNAHQVLVQSFKDSLSCLRTLEQDVNLKTYLTEVKKTISESINKKAFIFLFGNGGSATDCLELCEIAKTNNYPVTTLLEAGYLTCAYNDNHPVFARAFEELQAPHIAFGISTSGQSDNVNIALLQAKKKGLTTIALTGKTGGELLSKKLADFCYLVSSNETQRIQEVQFVVGQMLFS